MDVSKLVVVVESQGIAETTELLHGKNGRGGLAKAAEKVEKKVGSLTKTLEGMSSILASSFSTSAALASISALNAGIGETAASLASLNSALRTYTKVQDGANTKIGEAAKGMQEKHKWGGVMLSTIKAMTAAWAYYNTINLAKSMVKEADEMQNLEMRLKNLTGSASETAAGMNAVVHIANSTRTPIKDNATLFTRLYDAMKPMGKGGKEAAQASEAVALGLKLWGSTGGEAASAMLQLSQAFNKGKLDGQEFNSVAENGKPILKAIAAQLGVNISQLAAYRTAGKITNEVMLAALQKMLPIWRKQMAEMPLTFGDSLELIKNSWSVAMGDIQKDTGFNNTLANLMLGVIPLIEVVKYQLKKAFQEIGPVLEENKGLITATFRMFASAIMDVASLGKIFLLILGTLFGINQEVPILLLAFLGVKIAVSVIQSIFVTIGAMLITAASWAVKLVAIFTGLGEVIYKGILVGLSEVVGFAAKVAGFFGNDDLAKNLSEISTAIGGVKKEWMGGAKAVWEFGDAVKSVAVTAMDYMEDTSILSDSGYASVIDPGIDVESKSAPSFADGTGKNAPKTPDAKAAKAAEKAAESQRKLMASLRGTNEQLKQQARLLEEYGLSYEKLTPSEKQAITLEEQLKSLRAKHGGGGIQVKYLEEQLALVKLNAELERNNALTQDRLKSYKAEEDKEKSAVKSLEDEVAALQRKYDAYGKVKGEEDRLRAEEVQKKYDTLKASPEWGMGKQDLEHKSTMLAFYEQEIERLKDISHLKGLIAGKEAGEAFDKLLDPKKAEKFGDVLSDGMGASAKAMGKLANVLQNVEKRFNKIAEAKKLAAASGDTTKMAQAARMEVEAQVASMADLTGAAKGFFAEGSRGYRAMETAEKTFRAVQWAMQMESFLRESGFLTAITSLFVASEATKTAASAASLGPHLAVEGAKQEANATTALTSALAAPFPTNIAAYAMVAAMLAAIGVAVGGGGGGGGNVSKERQDAAGTGTVFGDSGAKSESISKAIESLSSNSDVALSYSSAMLTSLQNIEASLTGVTNAVVRQRGTITGADFNGDWSNMGGIDTLFAPLASIGIPTVVGSVMKSLGFGTSVDLQDSGISAGNVKFSDIMANGVDVKSYQDIKKTKKAFGISYSSSTSRETQDAGDEIDKQFASVFSNMSDIIKQSAPVLGVSLESALASVGEVQIDMSNISLKGLSSQEISDQISAVFSGYGDKLADAAFGSVIDPFRKAGEGGLETATRLATGIDSATYELEKLGVAAIKFTDISNKSGDVAAEMVRDSILVKEAGTGVGSIVSTLSGTAAEIGEMYTSLSSVRRSLKALNVADDVTASLIRAAGGLEALQDSLSAYTENFFSDVEQQAMKVDSLRESFSKLGQSVPASREDFRSLVTTLSAGGAAGASLAVQVMGLASSFDEVYSYIESNISDKKDALVGAYENESSAIQEVIDKYSDLAKSMREFRDSLLLDNLSTLSGAEKYNALKEQLSSTYTKAMGGDADSYARYQELAKSFLEASKDVYASSGAYRNDFNSILEQTANLESSALGKVDTEQRNLDLLTQQVSALVEIKTATLTVAQAIRDLQAAMAEGMLLDGSHKLGLASVPWDGYRAELHAGEAVLTASEAAMWRDGTQPLSTPPVVPPAPAVVVQREDSMDMSEVVKLLEGIKASVEKGDAAIVRASLGGVHQVVDAIAKTGEEAAKASYHANSKPKIA